MIVGTTEAARILNISSSRLRFLLISNRVEGAYKTGRAWLIPLFNGRPIIAKGKRGPAPRWCNPRKPAKRIIHVNTQKIRANHKNGLQDPVITVKMGNSNQYAHEVEIPGGCRIVYRPNNPFCGAKVWIESLYEVNLLNFSSPQLCI